jgi:hypothetical protein
MPKAGAKKGRYEVRPHASISGLVTVWFHPFEGLPGPTNIHLGEDAVPLLAEALAEWELAHAEPPPHRVELRLIADPPEVPQQRDTRKDQNR